MANTRQKPPDQLVNRRGGRGRQLVVTGGPPPAPPYPKGISAQAVARWRAFWKSEVAAAVDLNADQERIRRWIIAVDEREKLWKVACAQPLISSRFGLVKNPLWTVINQLTNEIQRAEEHFGMTPLSRFRLAFTKTESQHSLEDLMRKISEPEPTSRAKRPNNIVDMDEYEVIGS